MTEPAQRQPPLWLFILAFATIYVTWGTTYLGIRYAVHDEHLPPALFGGLRILTAGLIVLAFQVGRGKSIRITFAEAKRLLAASVFLFLLANWLVSVAEKDISSGMAAILAATMPLWLGLIESFWPGGDRLTWRGWTGLVIGLIGVVILMTPRLDGVERLWDNNWSPVLVLASAAAWAIGSLMVRHRRLALDHLSAAGYMMFFGGVGQIVMGLLLGEWTQLPAQLTQGAIVVFLYLLFVGSLGGFLAYNWLLGHVGAAKVGTYAYVNPIVAIALAWIWREPVTSPMLVGIGVILAAVALIRNDHVASAAHANRVPLDSTLPVTGEI